MPEKHVLTQRKYDDRKRKAGLTRVSVWVPERDRDELIDIAREMVEDFQNE